MTTEGPISSESPLAIAAEPRLGDFFNIDGVAVTKRNSQLQNALADKVSTGEVSLAPSLDQDGKALRTISVLTTEDQSTVRGGLSEVQVVYSKTLNEQGLMVSSQVKRSGNDAIPTTERVYTYTDVAGTVRKQLTGIEDYIYTPGGERFLALRQTLDGEIVQYPDSINEGNKRETATFLDTFFGSFEAGVRYNLIEQMARIAALPEAERLGLQITKGENKDGEDTITYSRPTIFYTPHLGADTLLMQSVTLQQDQGAWHITEVINGYLPATTRSLDAPIQDHYEISYDEQGRKRTIKDYFYNQELRRAVPFTESTYIYRPLHLKDGQEVEVYDVTQITYDANEPDTPPQDPKSFEFVNYVFLRGLRSGARSFFDVAITDGAWLNEQGESVSQYMQQPKIDEKTGEPTTDEHGDTIMEDIKGPTGVPVRNPVVKSFVRRVTLPNGITIQARLQLNSEGLIEPNQQPIIELSQ